jgi:hypothetical protein
MLSIDLSVVDSVTVGRIFGAFSFWLYNRIGRFGSTRRDVEFDVSLFSNTANK